MRSSPSNTGGGVGVTTLPASTTFDPDLKRLSGYKRLRIFLVITLLSALLGCHGPAPDRVCTHMLDVLGSTDVVSCTASMETVHKRMGRLRYRAYARCVLRAGTARAIIECRSNIE